MARSDTTYLDWQTLHNPWPYDAVNELRRFAARRARREAQWYRWSELRMLLAFATTCKRDGLRYVYRGFDIGWLRRERRRWQSKQR